VGADSLVDRDNLFAWVPNEVAPDTKTRSQRAARRCVVYVIMIVGASSDSFIVKETLCIPRHTGVNTGQLDSFAMHGII
jgi:hypothetical protein